MANVAEVNLTLKIHSDKNPVDMEYALETLTGCSAVVSILTDGILSKDVQKIRSSGDDIRTQLMDGYTGSYVQNFKVRIDSAIKAKRLSDLGNDVFSELMSYFFYEAIYIEPPKLSKKASDYLLELQGVEEELKDKIKNKLQAMHKISKMYTYPVSLKRTSSTDDIVTINSATANNVFTYAVDDTEIVITAMITRFNSFTGNGRLLTDDNNHTVAFGFRGPLSNVKPSFSRKVSENLHNNNRVRSEDRVYLKLTVVSMTNMVGDVIKYLITQVE